MGKRPAPSIRPPMHRQGCRPGAAPSFSRLLARAKEGEEIVITKGSKPQARIVPPAEAGQREAAPLKHLNLPDDLFDRAEPEQAMIDAGDYSDTLGIWRGPPKAS